MSNELKSGIRVTAACEIAYDPDTDIIELREPYPDPSEIPGEHNLIRVEPVTGWAPYTHRVEIADRWHPEHIYHALVTITIRNPYA